MQKILRIKDEFDTNTIDARVSKTKYRNNNLCPLCLLALSVIFLVFMRTDFLQKKREMFR